jgi:hypothetical protein
VAEAAAPRTALLIVERVVADRDPGAVAVMSDLNMMVNTGGAERTSSEWRALARTGGFQMTGTVEIGAGWHVIEAAALGAAGAPPGDANALGPAEPGRD